MRALAFLGLTALLGACHRAPPSAAAVVATGPDTAVATAVIGATAELRGTTQPCGCNSDPLGDLARIVPLLRGGLLVDAGDLTYPVDPVSEARRPQADLKAQAIAAIYRSADVALGPSDLVGPLRPGRLGCNVVRADVSAAPRVHDVHGIKVGVLAVSDPARVKGATDPAAAAKKAIAELDAQHAEVVVALLAMKRSDAHALMAQVDGIDFGIAGLDVEEGMPEPEPIGAGFLVSPADQGRRLARLELSRGGKPAGPGRLHPVAFQGASGQARQLARADKRIAQLRAQIAAWMTYTSQDETFIQARRDELKSLEAARVELAAKKPAPPDGPWFTYTLVDVKRALPRDPGVGKQLRELDHAIGQANLAAARGAPPPPADAGKPAYAGSAACAKCHKDAVAFWQGTRHAHAWKTLVDVDKQYDYDCIGCHVTGWQEHGGSVLGSVEKQGLVDVQCEVCHGPGSTHVAESGLDDPKTMHAPAPDLCRSRCHTVEHSDTFALDPYLRDVLGKGHGEARRKQLGEGPTGHALRQAALAHAQ